MKKKINNILVVWSLFIRHHSDSSGYRKKPLVHRGSAARGGLVWKTVLGDAVGSRLHFHFFQFYVHHNVPHVRCKSLDFFQMDGRAAKEGFEFLQKLGKIVFVDIFMNMD